MRLRRFTVYGQGTFPVSMLAADQCWPVLPAAQDALSQEHKARYREVRLESYNLNSPHPTRWREHGWSVRNVE